ncbi:MAG: GGDEF domain-containing protein [Myxococcaceae bacterium]|nr:GGDEF domain-containing protein [Myxococcaceae bacterium]MCA3015590.1 GGDEF domain-containing protein [Myxococcaceae bacterium]
MAEDKTAVHSIKDLLGEARKTNAAYLIVISARHAGTVGKMVKLEKGDFVLGRSPDLPMPVDDDGISRRHCKIVQAPNGHYQLVDLGSTNGTYLNGIKINVATLQDGDKIQIGATSVLKFSIQDQLEEQYQRSIYESATRDGLTRIFNKKYFLDTLRKEFAYCLRHRVPLSLVMFDIDFFKKINDTYGHPAGDYVLQKVAAKVGETVRQEDLFARYGGEEFALMLRESASEKSIRCAERCRQAVDGAEFTFNGTPIKVSISLGVATLFDSDFTQPEELISAADKYLYRAKRGGRNRVEALEISGP